jgi:type II secretory pathway pseudopilin PulG
MKMFGKNQNILVAESGFSLIEVLILIVVIGIAASTAMQWMAGSIDDVRRAKTEREMEMLADAIVGNPEKMSEGKRSDFGYVGDVGSFPSNLRALYENPGGYSTWDGPYIEPGFTQDSTGFKFDEWGQAYNYSGGITITSTGSGTTIIKKLADANSDYLLNSFSGVIEDSAGNVPGITYLDSVDVVVTIPNGSGSTTSKTYNPDSAGIFTLDSLPVGQHMLKIIFVPTVDTLKRYVTILPRHKSGRDYKFAEFCFSSGGGGLNFVIDSDSLWSGNCFRLKFWIENNSGTSITINSIRLTWSSPTAYYKTVTWDGITVRDSSPSAGSGDVSNFSSSQTIGDSEQTVITIEGFKPNSGGGGPPVNMLNTDFTVLFSDGSTFSFTADVCQ